MSASGRLSSGVETSSEQPDRHRHKDGQAKAERQLRLARAQGLLGGAYDSGRNRKCQRAGRDGYWQTAGQRDLRSDRRPDLEEGLPDPSMALVEAGPGSDPTPGSPKPRPQPGRGVCAENSRFSSPGAADLGPCAPCSPWSRPFRSDCRGVETWAAGGDCGPIPTPRPYPSRRAAVLPPTAWLLRTRRSSSQGRVGRASLTQRSTIHPHSLASRVGSTFSFYLRATSLCSLPVAALTHTGTSQFRRTITRARDRLPKVFCGMYDSTPGAWSAHGVQ
ncbi:uncharacterized protein LOC118238273 isoform X2 [Cricetulus griseus]|uniref:Uncharacterized protein LOC118238273 isoform X2 n=1 Tax=Cricetulus griseus TaxID=10029 RepID=A0A9J7H3M4_CRIGR|nr:uncharacterized protein LOC118238273 isoform X2 [Cricetulus griseus]